MKRHLLTAAALLGIILGAIAFLYWYENYRAMRGYHRVEKKLQLGYGKWQISSE